MVLAPYIGAFGLTGGCVTGQLLALVYRQYRFALQATAGLTFFCLLAWLMYPISNKPAPSPSRWCKVIFRSLSNGNPAFATGAQTPTNLTKQHIHIDLVIWSESAIPASEHRRKAISTG